MIDEYQDTNLAQYKLTSLLASKYKNIAVVGDDDQSIYGFRGAEISNILSFENEYKDAKIITLTKNYRFCNKFSFFSFIFARYYIGRNSILAFRLPDSSPDMGCSCR